MLGPCRDARISSRPAAPALQAAPTGGGEPLELGHHQLSVQAADNEPRSGPGTAAVLPRKRGVLLLLRERRRRPGCSFSKREAAAHRESMKGAIAAPAAIVMRAPSTCRC